MKIKPTLLHITLSVLLVISGTSASAQPSVFISNSFSDTLLCVNGSFEVPIDVPGTFADTNVFRVEISDINGSFSNSILVGNLPGNDTGVSYCTLPSSIVAGFGYKLRIVALYPSYISGSSVPLRVSDYPTINLTSNNPVCEGDVIQLGATSPNNQPTFDWSGPDGFSASKQQNATVNNVTLSSGGIYTGTVTSYRCSTSDTIRVNVTAPPKINNITPSQVVCEDEKMSITYLCNVCSATPGFGSSNIEWTYPTGSKTNQGGIYNNQVKPSDAGLYKLKVTIGSCSDSTTSRVTVKPLPDTPLVTDNGPLCVGQTLRLDGSSTTPGVSYKWNGPNGFYDSGANAKTSIPNISKAGEGEYKLYAYLNGCASKPGITDIKLGAPLAVIEVTGDTMLCPGDRLQLSAQTSQAKGIKWIKLPDTSITISQNRTFGKTVGTGDSGVYVVTQEVLGCKSPPSYVHINIPNISAPEPDNNGPLCLGEQLKLTAKATLNGTYNWTGISANGFSSTGQNPTLDNVGFADGGVYHVSVTLAHCTLEDSTVVDIKPMPEVSNVSSNSPVCTYTNLNLSAESTIDSASYEWTGPDGFKSNEQNPSVYYLNNASGTYYVKAVADGCVSESKSTVVESREGPGNTKARSNGPLTEGEQLELFANNDKDGVIFSWTGPDGFTSDEQNPVIPVSTYRNGGEYEVLSIYNTCTTTVKIVVDITDILGLKMDLYPNPNDGLFTIKGLTQTDELLQVNIFNHQGRIVYNGTIQPDRSKFNEQIDLRGAPSGVYMIQVFSGLERKSVRFTIVRQ